MVLSKSFSICLDVIRWSFEEALTICKKMKVILRQFSSFFNFSSYHKKQSLSIYSKILLRLRHSHTKNPFTFKNTLFKGDKCRKCKKRRVKVSLKNQLFEFDHSKDIVHFIPDFIIFIYRV